MIWEKKDYNRSWKGLRDRKKKEHYIFVNSGRVREIYPYLEGRVLDMGCGIGMMGKFLPWYWGVDFSDEGLKIAKEDNPHGQFLNADLNKGKLPYPDKMFHSVLLMEVVEHLKDYSNCLKEAKRLAKDTIVITVPVNMPNPDHYHPVWSEGDCRREFGWLGEITRLFKRADTFWIIIINVKG